MVPGPFLSRSAGILGPQSSQTGRDGYDAPDATISGQLDLYHMLACMSGGFWQTLLFDVFGCAICHSC